MAKTEIPLALVLPDVPDAHDQCISRLAKLIAKRPGISAADDGYGLCAWISRSAM